MGIELKNNKITLVAINSQYVHTNLAVHYIKSALAGHDVEITEDNVNRPIDEVFAKIIGTGGDIFAFSTYIFNIEYVKKLALRIKDTYPQSVVVMGGIEAENDAKNLEKYCDYILKGEGEKVFPAFIKYLEQGENWDKEIEVVGKIVNIKNGETLKKNIIEINSPYTEEYFRSVRGKIAYFEASRGCPFNCAYCMSSGTGVKYFKLEYIKNELSKFFGRDIKVLKFVDRTFNLQNNYSKEILRYIIDNEDKFSFGIHFEVAPELFDEEYFEIISKSKSKMLQFEIGMQTLNVKALEAINRKNDAEKIVKNITSLKRLNNCSIHCDLIAGLPHEDMKSFAKSFDLLYSLRPTGIQVGTLKVLKGSKIESLFCNTKEYICESEPPYTVTKTPCLGEEELRKIRLTEIVVNKLYNSGRFKRSLDFLIKGSPFAFFADFAVFSGDLNGKQLFEIIECVQEYAKVILKCSDSDIVMLREILRIDYFLTNKGKITPPCLFKKYSERFFAHKKLINMQNETKSVFYFETDVIISEDNGRFVAKAAETTLIISVDYSYYKNIVKEFGWRISNLLD